MCTSEALYNVPIPISSYLAEEKSPEAKRLELSPRFTINYCDISCLESLAVKCK